jgi:elongator complex protein 2
MLKFSINKKSDFIKIGKDQNVFTASLNYIVVLEQDARFKKSIKFSQEIKAFSVSRDYLVVGGDVLEICFLESGKIVQKDYPNVKVIEIFKDFIVIATESEIIILKIYNQDIIEFQKISKEFVISVKVGNLPGTQVTFIITGGTDNNLNVFLLSENSDCFVWKMVLKGHKDWIKSIDVKEVEQDLMMASASQDGFIRLWKISRQISKELNTDAHKLEVGGEYFYLTFHSLLVGHEDWVNSVRWYPDSQELKLVSASADKSIIIWSFDPESGVWYNQVRLGDVGGTVLGYYGALVLPGGTRLLAHGYHGALQAWDLVDGSWVSALGISGHSLSVQDICWNPSGTYLLSTSLDQTTRLYAEWNRGGEKSWHEMARTQIHGYDLQVLAFINEYEYVSGADEKILRVFEANRNFVESLEGITQTKAKYNKVFQNKFFII